MASNYPKLTEGSLRKILSNERVVKPVLQIIVYKQMGGQNNVNMKYRFQMTDGSENCSNFIVVLPELIQRIEKGEFEKFTVVELTNYVINQQPGVDRQIIVINDMVVVMTGSKIGRRLDKNDANAGLLAGLNQNAAAAAGPMSATPNRAATNSSYNTTVSHNSPVGSSRAINRANVCPIVAITPYFNAWLIKARVTSKAAKRNWSNARGEGTVFSFDVMDQSGEIRISAFNKEVERFYDMIEPGKVYYISKGTIKTANKRFSNLTNDYEITLQSDSVIEECNESGAEVPQMRFKFVKIRDLVTLPLQSIVDVIAIVKSYEEVATITSKKTNKELRKRDMTLLDHTAHEVRFTLWNEMAEQFDCAPEAVIAIKNAIIGEFNGRNLGSVASTTFHFEPNIPETNLLKDWYAREGHRVVTQSLSKPGGEGGQNANYGLICQINEQTVNSENRVYFNVRARIVATGRTPMYRACGQNNCLRKVQESNNGFFHCDKCQSDSPNFQWRIILSVSITDCTGETWVTVFHDLAEKMLGMTANELADLQDNNPQQFLKALATVEFKQYNLRLGTKLEQYMDETRVKSVAYNYTPIDPIKHSKELIQKIKKWTQ